VHDGYVAADAGAAPKRSDAIDALRGVAALSVVVFHCWLYASVNPNRPVRHTTADFALFETRIGLILFFVVSGFLLYGPFARAVASDGAPPSVRRYALRRVARILPAYYAALAGAVLLVAAASATPGARPVGARDLPLFLFFGQNYSGTTIMRLNPVTWTLCIEAAFYVMLPVFGLVVYRLARSHRWIEPLAIAALVALGIGWAHLASGGNASLPVIKALPAFLPYFAVGMMCAVAVRSGGPGAAGRLGLVALGAGVVAANGVWHATGGAASVSWLGTLTDLPAAAGFGLIVIAASSDAGRGRVSVALRPLAAVGVVSYGLYLWHVPLLLVLRGAGVMPRNTLAVFAVVVPIALVVATASWVFIERPALRWTRRPRPDRARPAAARRGDAARAAHSAT
jgi:peptidoglycan/LPS O-acetylase OafA/YrhL